MDNPLSLRKKPKKNTWKRILWELDKQAAFGINADREYYDIEGCFSNGSITAFTDRWKFMVIPYVREGVYVFRKDARWVDPGLPFGVSNGSIYSFDKLKFDYYQWTRTNEGDYVASVNYGYDYVYHYMDRVI